jgi:hypothetical protein
MQEIAGTEKENVRETQPLIWTSLKMRCLGFCAHKGCRASIETGQEMHWHHAYETNINEIDRPRKRLKRWISWYRKTDNPLVIAAYIQELSYCVLLCKKHHEKVHKEYRKEKAALATAQEKARAVALYNEYKPTVQNEHTLKKLMRERRKLWWVCVCVCGVCVCACVCKK